MKLRNHQDELLYVAMDLNVTPGCATVGGSRPSTGGTLGTVAVPGLLDEADELEGVPRLAAVSSSLLCDGASDH